MRRLALVVVHRRHRNHIAFVRSPGEYAAVERLEALGIGDASVEAAREVHRYVPAAKREPIGMHEPGAGKDRDRRRTGAHIDQGGAEFDMGAGTTTIAVFAGTRF